MPGTRLDAWLFRIIRNCWIDGVRRARLQVEVEGADANDIVPDGERHASLPWEQREVLLLICVDELSYREAAGILNVPIGTVMSRWVRARKRLTEPCIPASDMRNRG